MAQMLLFADPRPLVERLGADFFRRAPQCPGVYLMRDGTDSVLYVGKAKNLRKRLASYRVANPERLPLRHLRLLRAVERIELRACADEASALAHESALLRTLRPPFNRASTWPGPPRYLAWRLTERTLDLAVAEAVDGSWQNHGPLGAGAIHIRASLARVLWCAFHPQAGIAGLPEGWFRGRHAQVSTIHLRQDCASEHRDCSMHIDKLFAGQPKPFCDWILGRTVSWIHPFDLSVRDADLEAISRFVERSLHFATSSSKVLPVTIG